MTNSQICAILIKGVKRLLKAIILAAGVGKRLKGYFDGPKCLLKIGEKRLIERYLKSLAIYGIKEVVIVVGYKKDEIIGFVHRNDFQLKIKFIENPDFKKGSIISLWKAKDELKENILLMDADVYCEEDVFKKIIQSKKNNLLIIDTTSKGVEEEVVAGIKNERIIDMSRALKGDFDILGEWVGFLKIDDAGANCLKEIVEQRINNKEFEIGYEDVLPVLFKKIPFNYELVDGLQWVEIDFPEDIKQAEHLDKLHLSNKRCG